jgi:hypothetical protein
MSRGPGKMQTLVMDTLQMSSKPMSTADLRYDCELEYKTEHNNYTLELLQHRSIRMSMDRALRALRASGAIKRDEDSNWYPAKDWTARDAVERERSRAAYHEAGHAVIALACGAPVGMVTIALKNPHMAGAGYPTGLGYTYTGSRDIVSTDLDAFGNSPHKREWSHKECRAEILLCIAGAMAEAVHREHANPLTTWREFASPSDMRGARQGRSKLGEAVKTWPEYASECLELVRRHWMMIEAVADALLKKETLSGYDVDAICQRVVRRQHLKTSKAAA